MLLKLIAQLQRHASGRRVLVLFCITLVLYLAILFYSIPAVTAQAPGMRLFDMSPYGYSPAYAKELLSAIGPAGRDAYLRLQLPIDLVYPGFFAITYTMMLVWLFKKSCRPASKVFFLALVPAAAGLFDYLENIGILAMLGSFPAVSPGAVYATSACSVVKSTLTVAFYVLLLGGFVPLFVKARRRSSLKN
jgi:hypothetical protein